MRDKPMSQAEYDAVKATYPGQIFEGAVAYHWRYCSCGSPHLRRCALKLADGKVLDLPNEFLLSVGGNAGANLPEGTKVRIEIPPGACGPFNHFVDEPMMFRAHLDVGYLWCATTDREQLPRHRKHGELLDPDEGLIERT